mmetsp:Transcript_37419/g.69181  ORF Transcript_37419/g.69181 Transcript_37419/m.69181 type:complete len:202 (+) Transcript_37419:7263-7868(+)
MRLCSGLVSSVFPPPSSSSLSPKRSSDVVVVFGLGGTLSPSLSESSKRTFFLSLTLALIDCSSVSSISTSSSLPSSAVLSLDPMSSREGVPSPLKLEIRSPASFFKPFSSPSLLSRVPETKPTFILAIASNSTRIGVLPQSSLVVTMRARASGRAVLISFMRLRTSLTGRLVISLTTEWSKVEPSSATQARSSSEDERRSR